MSATDCSAREEEEENVERTLVWNYISNLWLQQNWVKGERIPRVSCAGKILLTQVM
jgi:hypothetical protein